MMCSEMRLMITDLSGHIAFTSVPALDDGSGWVLNAFTDWPNLVEVKYYNDPVVDDAHFRVASETHRLRLFMNNPEEVAHKVVELLTTRTLS